MATIASLARCADSHLDAYTDPAGSYAFRTYDQLYNFSGGLTPLDVFAANLLSLRLGHGDVVPLFRQGSSAYTALRDSMQHVLDATDDNASFCAITSIDAQPFRLVRDANQRTEAILDGRP
ncbi:hypothetical protein [Qaidamihabitans albus]|uniref:hypothetical protein n=1 Tax=Qaidamihabitans albus TaxID=2795733 RepID=UPI0018F234A7|nr:hypothetical protein [Qaidamihabitans albus]